MTVINARPVETSNGDGIVPTGDEPVNKKGGWHLHGASSEGVSFRSGFLDGAEIEKVLEDFIRVARPVLELTPRAVAEVSIRLSYGAIST